MIAGPGLEPGTPDNDSGKFPITPSRVIMPMMVSVHRLHRVGETPPQRSVLCQGCANGLRPRTLDGNRQAT